MLIAVTAVLFPSFASAEVGIPALSVITGEQGQQEYTVTLQILMLMTVMSFLPAMVVLMSSFTRIIVVLAILRQALGLQSTPSNQVLLGLALFMSLFIMRPVLDEVYDNALVPYMAEEIGAMEAFENAKLPIRTFMLSQTRMTDLNTFAEISGNVDVDSVEDLPMTVIIPSFVTSELKTAFQIGFMLFVPFLVIDLVVASVLMAMGMMMLSPMIVSLPFKIMLFVLVDGWNLVMGTLAVSFGLGTG
ncbi:flagellar type III secretion system pore protein FliP [Ferrimonas lipolytica]|uniref:Flagellar biosynthetic protein FliP n=1 Tax=Ferrimonas lipolytica TaxID=2724191 RepID=A0A6H1UM58_9GAMM|nr:flagellar type III secretion system pore protein FliP [Ferrimonas lipolytica]QIZ78882.1 flagellar type III secretion system pore protein FliP [Ferrimonas lipolytica]